MAGESVSPLRGLIVRIFANHGLTPMATTCRRSAAQAEANQKYPSFFFFSIDPL
jgi:hypothetical protein